MFIEWKKYQWRIQIKLTSASHSCQNQYYDLSRYDTKVEKEIENAFHAIQKRKKLMEVMWLVFITRSGIKNYQRMISKLTLGMYFPNRIFK